MDVDGTCESSSSDDGDMASSRSMSASSMSHEQEQHNMEQVVKKKGDAGTALLPCHIKLDKHEVARNDSSNCQEDASAPDYQPVRRTGNKNVHSTVSKAISSKDKEIKCQFCNMTFTNNYGLRRHKATVHNTEPLCKYCRKIFSFHQDVKAHLLVCKSKNRNRCKNKNVPVGKSKHLVHDKITSPDVNTNVNCALGVRCPICYQLLTCSSELKVHLSHIHNFNLYCEDCHRTFYSLSDFSAHGCSKLELAVHVKSELPEPASLQAQMHLPVMPRPQFKSYFEAEDATNVQNSCVTSGDSDSELKYVPVKCDVDSMKIKDRESLECDPPKHQLENYFSYCSKCKKDFHNNEICFRLLSCLYSFKDECKFCGKTFDCVFDLHAHVVSHKQPCAICLKEISRPYLLRRHMASAHELEPVCKKCYRFFYSYDELHSHKSLCHKSHSKRSNGVVDLSGGGGCAEHEGVFSHLLHVESRRTQSGSNGAPKLAKLAINIEAKCAFCGDLSASTADLKIHMNQFHGTKYLICKRCQVEFESTSDFVDHEKQCEEVV